MTADLRLVAATHCCNFPVEQASPMHDSTVPMCLLSVWQAAHAAHHAEGCLAYEMSVNIEEPNSFVVYER